MNVYLLALAVVFLVAAIRNHWVLRRAITPMPPIAPPALYPSVSVIRPIRGLDAGAEHNIRAALDHGYPGEVETLFVFDDATDPTLPLVREALARLPVGQATTAQVLFSGSPTQRQTGKLHAMLAGFARARHEIIVFADSDIRPGPHALSALVGARGRSPFIMGQLMALRRSAIAAIGGLESLEGEFVDDMHLGELITGQGLRNQLSWQSVPIIQNGLDLPGFWRLYRRWIAFSQSGLQAGPGSVKRQSIYRGTLFGASVAFALVAAALSAWPAALVGLAAASTIVWSIGALHIRMGGARLRPAHRLMALAILLLAPLVYLANGLDHDVEWRGRSYHLDDHARLAVPHKRAV